MNYIDYLHNRRCPFDHSRVIALAIGRSISREIPESKYLVHKGRLVIGGEDFETGTRNELFTK